MILILDFGSQYSQLIARKVRSFKVYSQIVPFNTSLDEIRALNPKGIIFSGGPASVAEEGSPKVDPAILELGVPMLAGLSRKRSLGELTGRDTPSERVAASVAAHLIAVQRGARIVRVHDVAATVDALKIWQAVEAVPTPRADTTPTIRWPDED